MRQLAMKYEGGRLADPKTADFTLRTYDESYREKLKDALIALTKERFSDAQLDEVIIKKNGVCEKGIFIAEDAGGVIGTATGYFHVEGGNRESDDGGTLHMVSALPEVKGRGVGTAVCTAAVNYLIDAGCKYVDLTTDDFRKSAIVIYTRLGFRPVIDDQEMQERWSKLAEELSLPELITEAKRV